MCVFSVRMYIGCVAFDSSLSARDPCDGLSCSRTDIYISLDSHTHMDMALLLIQSSVCCACALSRRDGKLSVDRSGTTPIMSRTKENVRKNTLSLSLKLNLKKCKR